MLLPDPLSPQGRGGNLPTCTPKPLTRSRTALYTHYTPAGARLPTTQGSRPGQDSSASSPRGGLDLRRSAPRLARGAWPGSLPRKRKLRPLHAATTSPPCLRPPRQSAAAGLESLPPPLQTRGLRPPPLLPSFLPSFLSPVPCHRASPTRKTHATRTSLLPNVERREPCCTITTGAHTHTARALCTSFSPRVGRASRDRAKDGAGGVGHRSRFRGSGDRSAIHGTRWWGAQGICRAPSLESARRYPCRVAAKSGGDAHQYLLPLPRPPPTVLPH